MRNKKDSLIAYFIKNEYFSGVLLLFCTILALIIANSNFASVYNHLLHEYLTIGYKEFSISMSVMHWINDGLMVIFFLVVGMEIKRELVIGELKSLKKAILPISAAIGGMIAPAIVYILFNYKEQTISGWGIPMATDIAFAIAILSLVGRKAPKGIVVFLTALAIVDDLGAILVIAIFYTNQIDFGSLCIGIITLIGLIIAGRFKVKSKLLYTVGGLILWISFLKSGIHATIAGVLLGMVLPVGENSEEFQESMLYKFEHILTPWSSLVIMPIFALANSGITIDFNSFSIIILSPVSLGIIFGLVIGKQLGIFGVSYILVKLNIAKLPSHVTKRHLYGASVLGGIGFTMSLFISSLTFSSDIDLLAAKTSILCASIISAVLGTIVFMFIEIKEKVKRV
ncbi:Na+/H+ antiporter NhaA [Clostridium paridis]|uniref:Na(+)/H(+) antiporter NhaA n=1 Tax=Clostridium paridis TaxID=2803863 RepID=A0A937FIW6_9CLOT|nr:Na+/H+ antiporter NhaA [Clostridium paridis]MBL4932988.1 Na+/H+ antiporter NhaA [Clostridium paridis]